MFAQVQAQKSYLSTGGRKFNNQAPFLIFLHGSGQSHLSWVLQTRFFAYEAFNVLAPDFPGHGLSEGTPLPCIEEMADWIIALMDTLGIDKAVVLGHSQGGLVALELAARYPARVDKLALIATALAIPVNDYLVSASKDKQPAAIKMMTGWGHGSAGHFYDNTQPGFSHLGFGRALMAGNNTTSLHADLGACNAYDGGAEAAAEIHQPCLVILAGSDKMTPPKKGRALAQAIAGSQLVEIAGAGHMLPSESPDEVNSALAGFLTAPA
jgi:pimeloyl-ACP methyl ester carboxylesterase